MTALAQERLTPFGGMHPSRGTYPIAANTKIYKGSQVALDSSGRAIPATSIASGAVIVVGKASATYDNLTGSALGGAAGAVDVEVEFGIFRFANSDSIAAANVGQMAYAVDDQTVAKSSSNGARPLAGPIMEVDSSGVWVYLGPHVAAFESRGDVQVVSVTVGEADLTAAATSQAIAIGSSVPAGARILGASIRLTTPFTGGGATSCVVDIGSTGDADALIDGANVFAAAVDGQASTRPLGIAPNKVFTSATQLNATFISDVNVSALTAGACVVDVYFTVIPV